MPEPIIVKVDKKHYKKCIKCHAWKPRKDRTFTNDEGIEVTEKHGFGLHEDNADKLQVICLACKNIAGKKARENNPLQRIRHHTGTRCLTQLGDYAPANFIANLESYLGYKINALVKHLGADLKEREGPKRKLRDALNEGYHIDHKHPLSLFPVICVEPSDGHTYVDWAIFRECWDLSNLSAIPAADNLAKGAKVNHEQPTKDKTEDATTASEDDPQEAQDEEREGKTVITIEPTGDAGP